MELLQISKDEQTCQKELQMAKKQAFNLKCQNKYLRIFSPICVAFKKVISIAGGDSLASLALVLV